MWLCIQLINYFEVATICSNIEYCGSCLCLNHTMLNWRLTYWSHFTQFCLNKTNESPDRVKLFDEFYSLRPLISDRHFFPKPFTNLTWKSTWLSIDNLTASCGEVVYCKCIHLKWLSHSQWLMLGLFVLWNHRNMMVQHMADSVVDGLGRFMQMLGDCIQIET